MSLFLAADAKRICPAPNTAPVNGLLVMKNEVRNFQKYLLIVCTEIDFLLSQNAQSLCADGHRTVVASYPGLPMFA